MKKQPTEAVGEIESKTVRNHSCSGLPKCLEANLTNKAKQILLSSFFIMVIKLCFVFSQ